MDFLWEANDAAEALTRRLNKVAQKIRKVERDLELAQTQGREARAADLEGKLHTLEARREGLQEDLEAAA